MMLTLHYHTDDVRLVMCEACEGSGNDCYWARDEDGSEYLVFTDHPCPYCNGTGCELIAVEPIQEEDLP